MTLRETSNLERISRAADDNNAQHLRDVLAAVAFLYANRLPGDLYDQLADADDRLVLTVANLINLRMPSRS